MITNFSPDDVRRIVREKIIEDGKNMRTWAMENGLTPSFLSAVLNGRKLPSQKVCTLVGLERAVVYRKKKS